MKYFILIFSFFIIGNNIDKPLVPSHLKVSQYAIDYNFSVEPLKAFLTVKGYAQYTSGGRGGQLLHVTNLNEYGTGSLLEAMQSNFPRIVVFDVSGDIIWTQEHTINNPNITILGQTAPEGGITIRGGCLKISANNVIVRYLRVRVGDHESGGSENDALRIRNEVNNTVLENVVVDHLAIGWATDELLSIGVNRGNAPNASVRNVTVQNSIIHENLDGFHYAALLGTHSTKISIIQNYWANNGNRVPEHTYGDGGSFEFVNNILYNYNRPVTISFGESIFDSLGNIFKPDSDYPPGQANHIYQLNNFENPSGQVSDGHVYAFDNLEVGNYNNPYGMVNNNWVNNGASSRGLTDSPYVPIPAFQVVDKVLNNVGTSPLFYDYHESRLIADFDDGNGIQSITNISQVGGFQNIQPKYHAVDYDTDGDGISDDFERTYLGGLSATSNGDNDNDGYTNIEEFSFHLANGQNGVGDNVLGTYSTSIIKFILFN